MFDSTFSNDPYFDNPPSWISLTAKQNSLAFKQTIIGLPTIVRLQNMVIYSFRHLQMSQLASLNFRESFPGVLDPSCPERCSKPLPVLLHPLFSILQAAMTEAKLDLRSNSKQRTNLRLENRDLRANVGSCSPMCFNGQQGWWMYHIIFRWPLNTGGIRCSLRFGMLRNPNHYEKSWAHFIVGIIFNYAPMSGDSPVFCKSK